MTFFAPQTWDGAAFVGGWTRLAGTRPVVSPSSGATLATVAEASPADSA